MDLEHLRQEAADMSESDLHQCYDWNKALAAHYDENMDFPNYHIAMEKIHILKAELAKRG